MLFFESRDCFKSDPPLSSFEIFRKSEGGDGDLSAALPAWIKDLQRAVKEAKRKLGSCLKMSMTSRRSRG